MTIFSTFHTNSLCMSGRIFAMIQWPCRVHRWHRFHHQSYTQHQGVHSVHCSTTHRQLAVQVFVVLVRFSSATLQHHQPTPANNKTFYKLGKYFWIKLLSWPNNMFDIFGSVKSLLKLDEICIDNNIFRLHYKVSNLFIF